jgi:hypothetical protein
VVADLVSVYNFRTGGSVSIDQKSWYLQDNWQVNDKFLAYIGVHNDSFNNMNGDAQNFGYEAVTLSAEKASDKWYVNASYTWSNNRGNTEGLVNSDNGQMDTGTTSAFDYPEVMIGANGYLPNDRRHSFKIYGGYKITPEWSVGLNGLLESGRPTSCFGGGDETVAGIPGYNSSFFYCDGKFDGRGRAKRLPWNWSVSPNVVYTPAYAKGLTLQLDVMRSCERGAKRLNRNRGVTRDDATLTRCSDNVFADLGFNEPDASIHKMRSELTIAIENKFDNELAWWIKAPRPTVKRYPRPPYEQAHHSCSAPPR